MPSATKQMVPSQHTDLSSQLADLMCSKQDENEVKVMTSAQSKIKNTLDMLLPDLDSMDLRPTSNGSYTSMLDKYEDSVLLSSSGNDPMSPPAIRSKTSANVPRPRNYTDGSAHGVIGDSNLFAPGSSILVGGKSSSFNGHSERPLPQQLQPINGLAMNEVAIGEIRKDVKDNYRRVNRDIEKHFDQCFRYLDQVKQQMYTQNKQFYNAQLDRIDELSSKLDKTKLRQQELTSQQHDKKSVPAPIRPPNRSATTLSQHPSNSIFADASLLNRSAAVPNLGSIWDTIGTQRLKSSSPSDILSSRHPASTILGTASDADSGKGPKSSSPAVGAENCSRKAPPPPTKEQRERVVENGRLKGEELHHPGHRDSAIIFSDKVSTIWSPPVSSRATSVTSHLNDDKSAESGTKQLIRDLIAKPAAGRSGEKADLKKGGKGTFENTPSVVERNASTQKPTKQSQNRAPELVRNMPPIRPKPSEPHYIDKHFNWMLGIVTIFSDKTPEEDDYLKRVSNIYAINVNTRDTSTFEIVYVGNGFYNIALCWRSGKKIKLGKTRVWLDHIARPVYGQTVRTFMDTMSQEFSVDIDRLDHSQRNMLLSRINTIFQLTARWEFPNMGANLTADITGMAISNLVEKLVRRSPGRQDGLSMELQRYRTLQEKQAKFSEHNENATGKQSKSYQNVESSDTPLRFYVKGLETGLDYHTFKDYFSKFGALKDCYVAERFNAITNKHELRGFGFIEFFKLKSAQACYHKKVHRIVAVDGRDSYVVYLNKAYEKGGAQESEFYNGSSPTVKNPAPQAPFEGAEEPNRAYEKISSREVEANLAEYLASSHGDTGNAYFNWLLGIIFIFSKQYYNQIDTYNNTGVGLLAAIIDQVFEKQNKWKINSINSHAIQFDLIEHKHGPPKPKNGNGKKPKAADPSSAKNVPVSFKVNVRIKNQYYEFGHMDLWLSKIVFIKEYTPTEFLNVLDKFATPHDSSLQGAKSKKRVLPLTTALKKQLGHELLNKTSKLCGLDGGASIRLIAKKIVAISGNRKTAAAARGEDTAPVVELPKIVEAKTTKKKEKSAKSEKSEASRESKAKSVSGGKAAKGKVEKGETGNSGKKKPDMKVTVPQAPKSVKIPGPVATKKSDGSDQFSGTGSSGATSGNAVASYDEFHTRSERSTVPDHTSTDSSAVSQTLSNYDVSDEGDGCSSSDEELKIGRHYEDELDASYECMKAASAEKEMELKKGKYEYSESSDEPINSHLFRRISETDDQESSEDENNSSETQTTSNERTNETSNESAFKNVPLASAGPARLTSAETTYSEQETTNSSLASELKTNNRWHVLSNADE